MRVVNHLAVSRTDLDRLNPVALIEIRGNGKADVLIRLIALEHVVLSDIDNGVRLADLPSFGIHGCGRQIAQVAFLRALIDPLHNRLPFHIR